MKPNKKLIAAGCTMAITLCALVVVSTKNGKKDDVLVKNEKTIKKTFSSKDIKVVYDAIKANDLVPFEEYINEGGSLNEIVEDNNEKITLAQAIVKHERVNFVHKVAEIQLKDQKSQLANVSVSEAQVLVPLVKAIVTSARPGFKKEVLNLSKKDPEVVKAVQGAATSILPTAVETCDQDQIRFLGDLGADPSKSIGAAGKTKCFKAISYWKKEQKFDFDKKNDDGVSGFDVLSKFKDPELQSFTDSLQKDDEVREIASLKPKEKRVSFYKKRVTSAIIDPEALVEPELRPDEATETAEFSEFSD